MKLSTSAMLLAASTFAQAGPVEVVERGAVAGQGEAIGGALDPPRRGPDVGAAGAYMTVSIINRQQLPISTVHVANAGSPTAVGGAIPPGQIAAGATAAFAVPTGYAGNLAIGNNQQALNLSCASLVELSYQLQGQSYAVEDIDVSYVDGFTDSITCACGGNTVTGCNKNLYAQGNTCASVYGQCCANPQRFNDSPSATAAPFFAPCAHKAYTYPKDDHANANGLCQGLPIVCCVGTSCPANPR